MAKLNIVLTDLVYNLPYLAAEVLEGETKDVASASADTFFTNILTPSGGPSLMTVSPAEDMFISIATSPDASVDDKRRLVFGGDSQTFLVSGGKTVSARLST